MMMHGKTTLFISLTAMLLASCAQENVGQDKPVNLGEGMLRLARSAHAGGDDRASEDLYRQVMARKESSPQARIELAEMLWKRGRKDESYTLASEMVGEPKATPQQLHAAAAILLRGGKAEKALPLLERGVTAAPHNAGLFTLKGVALDLLERHDEAVAAYDQGLAITPDNVSLHVNKGMSLLFAGKPEEAAVMLEKARGYDPAHAKAKLNLAIAYGLMGKRAEAEELGLSAVKPEDASVPAPLDAKFATLVAQAKRGQTMTTAVKAAPKPKPVQASVPTPAPRAEVEPAVPSPTTPPVTKPIPALASTLPAGKWYLNLGTVKDETTGMVQWQEYKVVAPCCVTRPAPEGGLTLLAGPFEGFANVQGLCDALHGKVECRMVIGEGEVEAALETKPSKKATHKKKL